MKLKSTTLGRHLAQHPYDSAMLLDAGIEVKGEKHNYIIPFTQLIDVRCKRGLVWGELEFELVDEKVVRLHGTEWQETKCFHQKLMNCWQQWSNDVSSVAQEILSQQYNDLTEIASSKNWLTKQQLIQIQTDINDCFNTLPIPLKRIHEFNECYPHYLACRRWLEQGDVLVETLNQVWTNNQLVQDNQFFLQLGYPLSEIQKQLVVNGEPTALVLAAAGSGKTQTLLARFYWLQKCAQINAQEILYLINNYQVKEDTAKYIKKHFRIKNVCSHTCGTLAAFIIQQSSGKSLLSVDELYDKNQRSYFYLQSWQQQCDSRKAVAKKWRVFLIDLFEYELPELFWQDELLCGQIREYLAMWMNALYLHESIAEQTVESNLVERLIELLKPIDKAWKKELKSKNAIENISLILRATELIEKNKFVCPWKYLLIDHVQEVSEVEMTFLSKLYLQSKKQLVVFAVGDDWQTLSQPWQTEHFLYLFECAFGPGVKYSLNTTYRFGQIINDICSGLMVEKPNQLAKVSHSSYDGSKSDIVLLPDTQLENLLDKLSGLVVANENVLILSRYISFCPEIIKKAKKRWPKLAIKFTDIKSSQGLEADYVVIIGLQSTDFAFPLSDEIDLSDLDNAQYELEICLLYIALSRSKKKLWLLYNTEHPSEFVDRMRRLGVQKKRKP